MILSWVLREPPTAHPVCLRSAEETLSNCHIYLITLYRWMTQPFRRASWSKKGIKNSSMEMY